MSHYYLYQLSISLSLAAISGYLHCIQGRFSTFLKFFISFTEPAFNSFFKRFLS